MCVMRRVAHAGLIDRGAISGAPPSDRSSTVWLAWIIGFIIWVAIAFWPARVADRKGHSFFGYFLLSLFFFPLALIMAYMVTDRTTEAVA
jgi:hypothetical protein